MSDRPGETQELGFYSIGKFMILVGFFLKKLKKF
jgi:GTP-binding protein EngB required for normal cell division